MNAETAGMRWLDLAVLASYLIACVALGLWVGRKSRHPEAFMVAGGRIPSWAVGLSIFGTYVSSISFLALPGKAFAGNWNAFLFSLSIPLAAWFAVRYFVPFYRAGASFSAYEHLEQRFGPWARTYAVFCYLLTQIARMGTIMYLLALALQPLTGWSIPVLILVTGFVVIVYTLYGGMEAVIWTDVVQSIVFIVGALSCVGVLLAGMPKGPGQLFEIAIDHRKFDLGSMALNLSEPTLWVVLLYGLFINLQNFGIDQSYVQRYHTARSTRDAAHSVWLGALLYLPISAVFFFIGTGLFAFYAARPELLPATVDPVGRPDTVFPHFIVAQLPVGFTGLLIASVFAAAQSTVSSSLNCSATLVLCDLYRRHVRPEADGSQAMRILRVSTLVFGIAGTAAAFAMMRIKSALDVWWEYAGIFSGGMLGLFLLGFICRRARSAPAALGVASGVLVILWMTLSTKASWPAGWETLRNPMHPFMIIVVGTMCILCVGVLASYFWRGGRPSHSSQPQPTEPHHEIHL